MVGVAGRGARRGGRRRGRAEEGRAALRGRAARPREGRGRRLQVPAQDLVRRRAARRGRPARSSSGRSRCPPRSSGGLSLRPATWADTRHTRPAAPPIARRRAVSGGRRRMLEPVGRDDGHRCSCSSRRSSESIGRSPRVDDGAWLVAVAGRAAMKLEDVLLRRGWCSASVGELLVTGARLALAARFACPRRAGRSPGPSAGRRGRGGVVPRRACHRQRRPGEARSAASPPSASASSALFERVASGTSPSSLLVDLVAAQRVAQQVARRRSCGCGCRGCGPRCCAGRRCGRCCS